MPRYKRTFDEAQLDVSVEPEMPPEKVETLQKLRNMWEFASFMQYVFLFGHVVKIDEDFDIEDLEGECLKSEPSPKLAAIGLSMLKYVSSHRGLSSEIFDEYTRRQYLAKAPHRNPFGDDEEPANFNQMDIFTRIQVLQQLSTWTLGNAERIRGMMPQDEDHLTWRIEPLGWDRDDNAYYVLDDNRLYRRSDEVVPPPTPKPKAKSKAKKSKSKATRSSKRRKVEDTEDEEPAQEADIDTEAGAQDDTVMTNGDEILHPMPEEESGYGFTDKTWSLVAITLEEYDDFLGSIFRSRDANEKQLHKRITDDVRPIIEKREEALRQKQLKKLRELENLSKMATAKRSSRLADKADKEKEEREKREAEEHRLRDIRMAHEEEERQKRIEDGHESRRQTREQRVKEREVKRILHEEELQRLQEEEERAASVSQEPSNEAADAERERKRISARQTQTQKEQHKKELAQLAEEADGGKWYFDCSVCGMHGENLDDGSHSLACDKCGVWQHSKCHAFTPKQAEKPGFTFICKSCKRQEADANKPKIPPLKLGKKASMSPEVRKTEGASRPSTANATLGTRTTGLPDHVQRQLDGVYIATQPRPSPGPFGQITNGPSLSPHGQAQGPPGYRYPPVGNFAPQPPQQAWTGSPYPAPAARPPSAGYASSPPVANGYGPPPPMQQHGQQHQYVHQRAVSATGAHPGYQPPPQYQQQPNGYSPRAPAGQHATGQPPQHPAYPPPHGYGQYQQPPPQHQQQQQQQPPLASAHLPPQQQGPHQPHLMNGFQSPVKGAARLSQSPQQQQAPLYYQQPAASHLPQSSPSLHQSPRTALPPPVQHTLQQTGQSPMKSSPPPPQRQQQAHQGPPQPMLVQTPQQQQGLRPPSSNGIAADGMSGPWPEGSKAIPQKHDPPPSSSPMHGDAKVVPPPGAALAPSPQAQQSAQSGGPASIPVKKPVPPPEFNGVAVQGSEQPVTQQPPQ